eukprot:CAMPEP_0115095736 /NCGR_PEP_ID=MMETSP0227-20121206/29250_1 /TAXON_ID=89957 /ORGANISM="Polarella glacialis, Strain CCMP 1383" /LENGTH=41 /DNA_ID= /DNA_START= /DNA_END= /DNA_ORIENTATION=
MPTPIYCIQTSAAAALAPLIAPLTPFLAPFRGVGHNEGKER